MGDLGGGGIGEMAGNVIVSASQVNNNTAVGMYSAGIVILLGGVTVTDGSQIEATPPMAPGGGIAANFEGAVAISQGSQVNGNTARSRRRHRQFLGDVWDHRHRSEPGCQQHPDERRGRHRDKRVDQRGLVPSVQRAFVSGGRGDAVSTRHSNYSSTPVRSEPR